MVYIFPDIKHIWKEEGRWAPHLISPIHIRKPLLCLFPAIWSFIRVFCAHRDCPGAKSPLPFRPWTAKSGKWPAHPHPQQECLWLVAWRTTGQCYWLICYIRADAISKLSILFNRTAVPNLFALWPHKMTQMPFLQRLCSIVPKRPSAPCFLWRGGGGQWHNTAPLCEFQDCELVATQANKMWRKTQKHR